MIRIKIDSAKMNASAKNISDSLSATVGQSSVNAIARAASSIAAKEFVKSINREARANKGSYHHLYEWGEVGSDSGRLFKVRRSVSGGAATLSIIYKKSKKTVPIAKELRTPGKTGKSVVRTSVFRNKAEFMEQGRSANWVAKRNVVFSDRGRLIFKRKGTVFNISNPGGPRVKGAMEKFANRWENGMASSSIDKSKIFDKIESSVARSLSGQGANASSVRSAIKAVCDSYDVGTEF